MSCAPVRNLPLIQKNDLLIEWKTGRAFAGFFPWLFQIKDVFTE